MMLPIPPIVHPSTILKKKKTHITHAPHTRSHTNVAVAHVNENGTIITQ